VDHLRRNHRDLQPQLYGRGIAKVGCNAALGRIDVANKILAELMKSQSGRLSEVSILRHGCPPAIHGTRSRPTSRVVLILLVATLSLAAGCGRTNAAPAVPSPEVELAKVVQKDVPIVSEWVATLDGYVNAQIQAQVMGYIVAQNYKEGSFVRKGQIIFQIDPRPFQALLDQAHAQLAQAQAQLGKTEMDVGRDTPLARERAIAQSQSDNDIQANRAAKAAVKAAEAQVEEARLNLDFTAVKSLVDGIAGIAQVQIGNLVNPTTVLTSVSQMDPIKVYFSISEQEYLHFAERINAQTQKEIPSAGPSFDLILADGSTYPHKMPFAVYPTHWWRTGRPANFGSRKNFCSSFGAGCRASFPHALHRRRHGLFGSLDERD